MCEARAPCLPALIACPRAARPPERDAGRGPVGYPTRYRVNGRRTPSRGAALQRSRRLGQRDPPTIPRPQGAPPGRDPLLPPGRLLRDLRRRRGAGQPDAGRHPDQQADGTGAARAPGGRARAERRGAPGAADRGRPPGRHRRAAGGARRARRRRQAAGAARHRARRLAGHGAGAVAAGGRPQRLLRGDLDRRPIRRWWPIRRPGPGRRGPGRPQHRRAARLRAGGGRRRGGAGGGPGRAGAAGRARAAAAGAAGVRPGGARGRAGAA